MTLPRYGCGYASVCFLPRIVGISRAQFLIHIDGEDAPAFKCTFQGEGCIPSISVQVIGRLPRANQIHLVSVGSRNS